jgi:hypothetical protein
MHFALSKFAEPDFVNFYAINSTKFIIRELRNHGLHKEADELQENLDEILRKA